MINECKRIAAFEHVQAFPCVYNANKKRKRAINMFDEIKRFMQRIDGNGDWINAERDEVSYMYEVMAQWIDDGMTVTASVKNYMLGLERMIMDDLQAN